MDVNNRTMDTLSLLTRGHWRASLVVGLVAGLAIFLLGLPNQNPILVLGVIASITGVVTALFTRSLCVVEAEMDSRSGRGYGLLLVYLVIGVGMAVFSVVVRSF